jgi:hypothetical protein
VRFRSSWALTAAVAVLLVAEIIVIAPRADAWVIVATQIWMALPGVALARRAFGADSSRAAAWFVGPAIGFGFSVFGLLLFWAAGVQNWVALVGAPALTWLLAAIAGRTGGLRLRLPRFDRRDVAGISAALMVVPLITWAPYDHVAEPVPDGEAYRAYFTADFVWAMTVTAELAKGDVPPVNPFLSGQPVRYYWMSHLLSGAIYRNTRGRGVTAEQVVLLDGLAFSTAFVGFCYALVRFAGGSAAFAALAIAVGFLANSYEAFNRFWVYRQAEALFDWKDLNIDAVTRWFYQGMPVDGLQRLFLYQPHHLTGYVLALSGLWIVGFAEDVTDMSIALWAGVLLGLGFLFSTFTAIIIGLAVGVLFAARLIADRRLSAVFQCAILGAGPIVVAIFVSMLLGYTDPREGFLIRFGINRVALRQWPLMFLLSFGPLLFAGLAGLLRVRWVVRDGAAVASLVLSALVFYFIADVPDMGGVWVGWRSGHLLLIGFAVIGGAALSAAWRRRGARLPLAVVSLVAIAFAVPTVAMDIYNAQDITNRRPGPNFPWTLIIKPQEREALDWLKRATPADAIVQIEPTARETQSWAFIPAFAERRMSGGLPISMIPLRPYREATQHVRMGVFLAPNAQEAHAMAEFLGIDYLYVGDLERDHYRQLSEAIAERPDLFPVVFKNESVTIHGVTRSR